MCTSSWLHVRENKPPGEGPGATSGAQGCSCCHLLWQENIKLTQDKLHRNVTTYKAISKPTSHPSHLHRFHGFMNRLKSCECKWPAVPPPWLCVYFFLFSRAVQVVFLTWSSSHLIELHWSEGKQPINAGGSLELLTVNTLCSKRPALGLNLRLWPTVFAGESLYGSPCSYFQRDLFITS